MSLPIKVKVTKTGQTKVLKFVPTMSIAECCKTIVEKGVEGGSDHGLFQPAGAKNPARWLRNDRTVQFYDLQPNDELEYKKRHRPIKIKLLDQTIKTVLIDDTLSVADIVKFIGEKMSVSNAEEYSLKIDGKDEWLNSSQSLHEQGVPEDAVLLIEKKFFVTDAAVSVEDPVSLHLVYIQSRDAILSGKHPCTEEEALQFGALQCQILYGSFDPAKNRKYELEKLVPPQWQKGKKIEEKLIKEHKKYVGMSDANAKYRYVQLCRSLKTYGITFFPVKLKQAKGNKKGRPFLLGITRDAVLFMDEETKDIIKEAPLTHLRRWAAAPTNFTLDFGDHEAEYAVLETKQGEQISSLLAGYIDIILKKRREGAVVIADDNDKIAEAEPIAPISSNALTSITMSTIRGFNTMSGTNANTLGNQPYGRSTMGPGMAMPTNLTGAQSYVSSLISDMNGGQPFARNAQLSVQQWRNQLISNTNAVVSSVGKLNAAMPPNMFDKGLMDAKAAEIAANLAQLISAARNAAVKPNGDEDLDLLNGAKKVADAIKELLTATKELGDRPNDPKALERYQQAQRNLAAATNFIMAANKGNLADDPSQMLLQQSGKNVASAVEDLLNLARQRNEKNPTVMGAHDEAKKFDEELQGQVNALAASILDPNSQRQLELACLALNNAIGKLCSTAQTSGDPTGLLLAAKGVGDAISQLLSSSRIAEPANKLPDFATPAKEILDELTRLIGSYGNPAQINQSQKFITASTAKIAQAARDAANLVDPETSERLLSGAKGVAAATQKLIQTAQVAAANPNDPNAHKALQDACQRLSEAIKALVGDAAEKAAMQHLRSTAKAAAAATSSLVYAAKTGSTSCSDPTLSDGLKSNSRQASEALGNLVRALEQAWRNLDDPSVQGLLLRETNTFSPLAYKLVAAAKSALPKVTDPNSKNLLRQTADDAAEALQKLVGANKAVMISSGQAVIDQALDRFAAEEAGLDAALLDVDTGSLDTDPNQTPEGAAHLLNIAARQVAGAIKTMATTAKTNPDELGQASSNVAEAVAQTNTAAKVLASTVPDRAFQRSVLSSAKDLTVQARNALTSARGVASNPSDPNLNSLLATSARGLAEALTRLLAAAKGVPSSNKDCDDAVASIQAALKTVEPKPGNPKDYPLYAEDLENSIKAIQAATIALVNAAKNNPKGVGAAAKATAITIPPMVIAANSAAGTAPNPEAARNINQATVEAVGVISDLITSAKVAAVKDDPALRDQLSNSMTAVSSALEKLLAAVNATPAQKQFSDAIEEILHAASKLSQTPSGLPSDMSTAIDHIKTGTTKLGEATKGIISGSRSDVEVMGPYAKQASQAVALIVDASMNLAGSSKTSIYMDDALRLREAANELVATCQQNDPTSKQAMIKAAKEATLATQSLSNAASQNATLIQPSNPRGAQALMNASQSMAAATSGLVNAARSVSANQPNSKEALYEAHESLEYAIEQLLAADPNPSLSAKGKKLVGVAREAASATTAMIELSRTVHKRPTDTQAISELSQSARAVGAAIKGLLDAAKSIGEIDLEESINKITNAISDLDQATISATVGLLENSAGGKTSQQLEEELVEVSRDVANGIRNLVSVKEQPINMAKEARNLANMIPQLAKISTALASISSDPDYQQQTLQAAKSIADSGLMLINACKQNDQQDIVLQAKESSQAIAKLLSSMKGGVLALRDCDEAARVVLEAGKPLDGYNLRSPVDTKKSYADGQRELTAMAKELAASLATVVQVAKNRPQEVGESSKRIAALMPKFVADTIESMSTIAETDVRSNLLESSKNVVQVSAKLIMASKLVASNSKNTKTQQQMSVTYKEVTEAISGLVFAIKKGATGELKCEESIDVVNKKIGELDSAALFAATGQLQADGEVDLEQAQLDMDENCKRIQDSLKKLIVAAPRNQQDLGNAASEASDAFENVVKDVKAISTQVNNLLTQQELLMGAKGVGITIQLAITNGLNVNKNPDNDDLKHSLADTTSKVSEAIKDLQGFANTALAGSGIKDIENAKKVVQRAMQTVPKQPGNNKAGAAEILKAAKVLADSVATISTTGPEEGSKVVQAAEDIGKATTSLLNDAKGAARLIDATAAKKLFDAAMGAGGATVNFLEVAKVHRRLHSPETQMKISEANDELVKVIAEVVEATKPLPGSEEALKLFQETDELEALAEQELRNAASIIEDAARTLLDAKQRQLEMRKNKDSPLPEEEINEAIIDAARAITTATATLVHASTYAQKELVDKGKVEKKQNVYRRDPAWAKGLISAAQAVAGSVKGLVVSANGAVSGKAEEEALVASAKGVAAATARLVYASRTKADPFSPTQKNLTNAAKTVAAATKQLVEAARSATQTIQDTEARPDWDSLNETAKQRAEIEQQTKILKLAKELEMAQQGLRDIRKKEYQDNTNQPPAKQPPVKAAAMPSIGRESRESIRLTSSKEMENNNAQPAASNTNAASNANMARRGTVGAKKVYPGERVYTYEQLRSRPQEIDLLNMEKYLSDDEFTQVFKMDRAAFEKQPEWKKNNAKKQLGLL